MADNEHHDDPYDLASEPPEAKAVPPAARAAGQAKVLRYQTAPRQDGFDPDRLKNLHAPLALFAGSLLVQAAVTFWNTPFGRLQVEYLAAGIELVISTCLLLIVFRWCAHHRGFAFGKFGGALLKLMAISVTPSAAIFLMGVLLSSIPFGLGYVIAWVLGFCFYFALIGYFFDLDQDDTWFCVITLFLTKLAVYVVVVLALR